MHQYLHLVRQVHEYGQDVKTRNGIRRRLPSGTFTWDCSSSFPVVTTKKVSLRFVFEELKWFLSGSSDIEKLESKGVTIWSDYKRDENWTVLDSIYHKNSAGRIYSVQWRSWVNQWGETVDQIKNLINLLKTDPFNSNLVVNAWNPGELEHMALPPCHFAFICFVDTNTVTGNKRLNLKWLQRSCDLFLGVPFNISSYAMLLHMLAYKVGMEIGYLYGDLTNIHLYENQIKPAEILLTRTPKEPTTKLTINKEISEDFDISEFVWEDMSFTGYEYHPPIKVAMVA